MLNSISRVLLLTLIVLFPLYLIFDIVRVKAMAQSSGGCGTAFFVNEQGTASTAAHVIGNAKRVFLMLNNGKTAYEGRIVAVDYNHDLAFIQFGTISSYLHIGSIKKGVVPVTIYGYPEVDRYGYSLKRSFGTGKFTVGLIRNTISYKAVIRPGNSGGPAIDNRGLVVGTVNVRMPYGAQGWGSTSQDIVSFAAKKGVKIFTSNVQQYVDRSAIVYICAI